MGLRTTTVGWFPKPVDLRRARWRFAEGEIDEAKLREVEAEATRNALTLQDELGLDLPVETANYLLTRKTRDMASLYSLLDKLDQEALKAQRRLTIPFVKTVLSLDEQ